MFRKNIFIGIFLLSLSLLLFELTLIRVYSTTLFYHFAFMAIGVAMLGLSAAGLTVYLWSHRFRVEKIDSWTMWFSLAYGVSVLAVLWCVFRIPVNPYLPPDEIAGELILIYILSAIPCYLAGIVISGLFAVLPREAGKLYAWDLVGAGIGAMLIIPLLNIVGGETAGFCIGFVGLIAAAFFGQPRRLKIPVIAALVMLVMGLTNSQVGWLQIRYSKGQPFHELDIRYNRWNSFSMITAIPFRPGTDAVYTWCPSPNFPLPYMEHLSIMIDDGASTPVLPFDGKNLEPISYLKYDLTSLAHRMRGSGTTLVIGCGGGRDVLTGLMFDAQRVDALDVNPLIFEAMNGPLADFNGHLFSHPKVRQVIAEGRAYVRRHPAEWDLVQVAMIDTWAATTAGAYALTENNLYTIEAFEDYFRALKPGGVLSFTRFFFYPPRQALRLVSLFLEAAEHYGISDPGECMLVAKHESLSTLLFKIEPFTPEEISRFKADLDMLGFELVYAPDERPDRFFASLVSIPDRQLYYEKYPFNVSPPTDNQPFFFNLLKMKDFLKVFEIREGLRFNYYATYTLIVILILSIVATAIVLILPIIVKGVKFDNFPGKWRLLLYFIAIGLAYIMIEVALLQRFVLLLEHPTYAASGVVAGLLISSGIGSLIWGLSPWRKRQRILLIAFIVIFAGLLFHSLAGGAVIHKVIFLPMVLKVLIAAILIVPLGIAMGMPLPAGITVAGQQSSGTVAWCWALNGAASVVASPLAVTVAMAYGFSIVLFAGLLAYLTAFALVSIGIKYENVSSTHLMSYD